MQKSEAMGMTMNQFLAMPYREIQYRLALDRIRQRERERAERLAKMRRGRR